MQVGKPCDSIRDATFTCMAHGGRRKEWPAVEERGRQPLESVSANTSASMCPHRISEESVTWALRPNDSSISGALHGDGQEAASGETAGRDGGAATLAAYWQLLSTE